MRGWTPISSGESGARVYRRGERIAKVGGDLEGERRLATMFALAEAVVAEDRERLRFYLALDPLTWRRSE